MNENEMLEEIESLSPSEEAISTMLIRYKNLKSELEKEKEKNKILLQCLKDSQERCENEHLFLGNPDM